MKCGRCKKKMMLDEWTTQLSSGMILCDSCITDEDRKNIRGLTIIYEEDEDDKRGITEKKFFETVKI